MNPDTPTTPETPAEPAAPEAPRQGDVSVALRQAREELAALKSERDALKSAQEQAELAKLSELERAQHERDSYKEKYESALQKAERTTKAAIARVELSRLPLHDGAEELLLSRVNIDALPEDGIAKAIQDVAAAHPYLLAGKGGSTALSGNDLVARLGAGGAPAGDQGEAPTGTEVYKARMAAQLRKLGL